MDNKLRMQSVNKVDENVKKIAQLFPNCVTEGKNEDGKSIEVVDFDMLKQELTDYLVEGKEERYQFTWPDKRKTILASNAPTNKTLRPIKAESVDFNKTENMYIEGDNLDVLKLLRETYLGRIKMIYIDPPYNTGKDFIYEDNFAKSIEEYLEISGQFDDSGNRLLSNTENNGRFHSDWLNLIYPRLKTSKDLLSEDGIIFISIDDNEYGNMKKIMDEVFGERNSLIPFIWELPRGINAGHISKAHEYVIAYAKNKEFLNQFLKGTAVESIERCNKKIDARHPASEIIFPAGFPYEGKNQTITGVIDGSERVEIQGEMILEDGILKKQVKLTAGWTMKRMIQDWIDGKKVCDLKGQEIKGFFIKENGKVYSRKEMIYDSPKSILKGLGDSQSARKELGQIFGTEDLFDYPKPTTMIEKLTKLVTKENDIVLDFFSGSGSTAHAVLKANQSDKKNRKFILVQLDEKTKTGSIAHDMGYENICEIGKERIRRCGEELKESSEGNVDIGFRVLRLDTSNMKEVYYNPSQYELTLFDNVIDNIKEDRTSEDLLFQVMLDLGVLLSSKIEEEIIEGKNVFNVADGYLMACFDKAVTEKTIEAVAKKKPYYFVMRDFSLADDNVATNFNQIFEMYSPETIRKVL